MNSEYELISFPDTNYKFSMVNILYCAPHVHKEWEICLMLDGAVRVFSQNRNIQMQKGDMWIINPFKSHELTSSIPDKHALVIELQIPTSFFHAYYPQMENTEFEFQRFDTALSDDYQTKKAYHSIICRISLKTFLECPFRNI